MQGSCLCGKVHYKILSAPRSVVACHCTQCRKTSGHYVAATQVSNADIVVTGGANITWFQSSDTAKRGFCKTCGSQLFWTEFGTEKTSVMAGTLDGDTHLKMDRQLFSHVKGDYYPLPEASPVDQNSQ